MKNTVMYETIVTKAEALGEDIFVFASEDAIRLTVNDFEGFNADWEEVMRDLDNPQGVQELLGYIATNALESDTDTLYKRYEFEGFSVIVGYGSYDI